MPYKLNAKGFKLIHPLTPADTLKLQQYHLTDMQVKALDYLKLHLEESKYIGAAEVAQFYGYPNGQYFRGVLASLYHYGLVDKKEM